MYNFLSDVHHADRHQPPDLSALRSLNNVIEHDKFNTPAKMVWSRELKKTLYSIIETSTKWNHHFWFIASTRSSYLNTKTLNLSYRKDAQTVCPYSINIKRIILSLETVNSSTNHIDRYFICVSHLSLHSITFSQVYLETYSSFIIFVTSFS